MLRYCHSHAQERFSQNLFLNTVLFFNLRNDLFVQIPNTKILVLGFGERFKARPYCTYISIIRLHKTNAFQVRS